MSLEDRIAAAERAESTKAEPGAGPMVPRQRRDAYDAYAEVHALVRDIYERVSQPR
jgi:hypothetical protein